MEEYIQEEDSCKFLHPSLSAKKKAFVTSIFRENPVGCSSKFEQHLESDKLCNEGKHINMINTRLLSISLCNQTSFESVDSAIRIILDLIDPFVASDMFLCM